MAIGLGWACSVLNFCTFSWKMSRAKITKTKHCRKKPPFIFKHLIAKYLHVNFHVMYLTFLLHGIHKLGFFSKPGMVNVEVFSGLKTSGHFLKVQIQLMLNIPLSLGHWTSFTQGPNQAYICVLKLFYTPILQSSFQEAHPYTCPTLPKEEPKPTSTRLHDEQVPFTFRP